MPSILSGLGKESKVRKFVLEMDNNYHVQSPKRDNKISKVVVFLIVHGLEWWTNKNAYELKVVASLNWVGFMKLLVERFISLYQQLFEGMNLVQMRLTGPLKAYELDLNAPMNATPKMDNFAKKCIFLGEKAKVGGGHLV
jgi:hypothetical protein